MIATYSGTVSGVSGAADIGPICGKVLAVYIAHTNGNAGADVTLTSKSTPAQTVLTLTNNNTSGWRYPRVAVHDATGVALTYDGTRVVAEPAPIDDYLTLTVAQNNSNGVVTATVLVEI